MNMRFKTVASLLSLALVSAVPAHADPKKASSASAANLRKAINRDVHVWSEDATLRADPRGAVGIVGLVYAQPDGSCSNSTTPVFRWEQIILPRDNIMDTVEAEPVRRSFNNGKVTGSDDLPFLDIQYDEEVAHTMRIDDRAVYRLRWNEAADKATKAFLEANPAFTDATKICKVVAVKGVVVRRFEYQRLRKTRANVNISWVLDGSNYTEDGSEEYATRYGLSLAVVWWNPALSTAVVPQQPFRVDPKPPKPSAAKVSKK